MSAPLGALRRRAHGSGFTVFQSQQPGGLVVEGHAHAHASLCFLLRGSFQEIGRRAMRARGGDVVVTAPEEAVDLRFGPGLVQVLMLEIEPRLWYELASEGGPPEIVTERRRDPTIRGMAEHLYLELADAPDDGSPELALEETVLMLSRMIATRAAPAAGEPLTPTAWARALEALHEGFPERISLVTVAAHAGVHKMSLARAFRRRLGLSVGDYLHRLRTSYAMALLAARDPRYSLAEIAVRAGFADQSHLSRVFKRVSGRTPAAFRRAVSIVQDRDAIHGVTSVDEDVPGNFHP